MKRLLCYLLHRRAWELTFLRDGFVSGWRMQCHKCGACHGLGEDEQRSNDGTQPVITHTITYGKVTPKFKGVTRPGKAPL